VSRIEGIEKRSLRRLKHSFIKGSLAPEEEEEAGGGGGGEEGEGGGR
jgi:hypothetical protein